MSLNRSAIRAELRRKEWRPSFRWLPSIRAAAEAINAPHEDYPRRVEATAQVLDQLSQRRLSDSIPNSLLTEIHRQVFADTGHAGKWRETDVQLGSGGTKIVRVAELMQRLEAEYEDWITDLDAFIQWYVDFESVHPFPDGNGRVGGIIVASYGHAMHPNRGWLAPCQ